MITPKLIKQAIQETREFGEARCVERRYDTSPIRVYADDGAGTHPVHGAFYNGSVWVSTNFRAEDFSPSRPHAVTENNTTITVRFSDGQERTYEVSDMLERLLAEGSTAVALFRHPKHGEMMHVSGTIAKSEFK